MFEQKLPSEHIKVEAYTHAAFTLGQVVALASGNVTAISDGNYEANAPISVTIGQPASVTEVPILSGVSPGDAIFADASGALSTTTSGRFYGFVVEQTSDTTRIAHIGA